MRDIFLVHSASKRVAKPDEKFDDECFLTLTDCFGGSENRYYIRLTGKSAKVDWQKGDRIMVDIHFHAYKHKGLWRPSHNSDEMKLIEIGQILYNNYEERKEKGL